MTAGEEILFTDVRGNVFKYNVSAMEIIEPTDVENMISGDWDLTLFTCTPGGKTRQTVRCRLVAYKLHNSNNWVTE
jgi:Sortase (surface protein transpeptidase)